VFLTVSVQGRDFDGARPSHVVFRPPPVFSLFFLILFRRPYTPIPYSEFYFILFYSFLIVFVVVVVTVVVVVVVVVVIIIGVLWWWLLLL